MSNYTGQQLRHATVDAMLAMHASTIKDLSEPDPTPTKIERLLETAGAGWELGQDGEYTSEAEAEWCGYTIAAAARQVGDYLEDDRCVDVALARPVAVHCLPSTGRMASASRWQDAGVDEPLHPEPANIRRGDIVAVTTSGTQPHGDHLVLARGRAGGETFPTVEGNATGELGDGTWGEGVVTRIREVGDVYQVYRLSSEHFTGECLS